MKCSLNIAAKVTSYRLSERNAMKQRISLVINSKILRFAQKCVLSLIDYLP